MLKDLLSRPGLVVPRGEELYLSNVKFLIQKSSYTSVCL